MIIIVKPIKQAIAGERNHENTILINLYHAKVSAPEACIPAPRRAPITVCVPEIGTPKKHDVIMNRNEHRQTENIILFCFSALRFSIPGTIS